MPTNWPWADQFVAALNALRYLHALPAVDISLAHPSRRRANLALTAQPSTTPCSSAARHHNKQRINHTEPPSDDQHPTPEAQSVDRGLALVAIGNYYVV